jgi:two-component system, LuxR family, sensor histidine kinase DctS
MSKSQAVSVLLVEDDSDYALLVRDLLEARWSSNFQVVHVQRLTDALGHLRNWSPDCILLDLTLPDARCLEALAEIRAVAPDLPVVISSGLEDELLALKAVKAGAQEYLVKGRLDGDRLGRSIFYAIECKRDSSFGSADAGRKPS